ncbi:MAG: hypothetical protein K8I27_13305 [Planctomycetes bacterium]|nr:hypothetical protein [Planctomycetota bacterium]
MQKNEDHIWDVLIEDALREQPLDQAPPGDHTRRLLQPVGPLGIDRGRSMRRGGRRSWVSAAVAVGALVLVAAILYGGAIWLPKLSEANKPAPDQPQAAEETNQSPPHERWSPTNQPTDEPNDKPEPHPEDKQSNEAQPEPKPDKPVPAPEPIQPDDSGEEPKALPEPKPVKPDDVVEEPDNKEPEDRETVPVEKPQPGFEVRLLSKEPRTDLRIANAEYMETGAPAYRVPKDETVFADCSWFRCDKPVDLEVKGILVRLDGEMRIEIYRGGGSVLFEPGKGELFLDSRGTQMGTYVSIRNENNGVSIEGGSGCAMYEVNTNSAEVFLYEGELQVSAGGAEPTTLSAGKRVLIRNAKIGDPKDLRKLLANEPFLSGLAERVAYRENFDADPDGRLREGELIDGAIRGDKVFWGYPANVQHEPGLAIRLRVRFTNATTATLTQFCPERNDNYSIELRQLTQGQWHVLEVRVDDLLERTKHEGHPQVGESFMNISLITEGENAQVELDWVELIRAVK